MAKIIDDLPKDLEQSQVLIFNAYLSPRDKQSVLGYFTPYGVAGERSVTWLTMPFGVPIEEAFHQTIQLADYNRIPFVLVMDPDNLFPPDKRPDVSKA